ncbi:MAG TPA: PadR family transcriptional regulator [Nocardioidaceae bacterium]|nr:PadR family transcriptional regulator [Nocardioidaceae bacterium]
MSRPGRLTTTSYAVLGLIAIKPFSTYELTAQMDRSFYRIWPRSRSKLYEEPKKLVAHGLAVATRERVGKRPRTVYSITAAGRAALAEWLQVPGSGPALEFEQILKITFVENGTKDNALAQLAAARAWAVEQNEVNRDVGRAYARGEGLFQERAAINMIGGAFLTDFYALVARWADWATELVQDWPDSPSDAVLPPGVADEVVKRADWS